MASVHARKRTDGSITYRVQFRDHGAMRSKTFMHLRGAEQFAAQVERVGATAALNILAAREHSNDDIPTFREFASHYLDPSSGLLTGIQTETRSAYAGIVDRSLNPILGDIPIDAITKADVGRWVTWQEAQPSQRRKGLKTSAKTVRNYHALLSSIFTAAVEVKHRPDNPARGVRMTRGQRHEPTFLTRNEVATLLHFTDPHYRPLVSFLVATGMRWSEATALQRRDVDVDVTPATVRVTKAWKKTNEIGPPKSERSNRTVSLWPEIVDMLDLEGDGEALLFRSKKNLRVWYGPFKTRVWDPAVEQGTDRGACADAGLPPLPGRATPHDLRHTHASWLIASGAPLPYIQARLGHENITTTVDTYGHLLPVAHAEMSAIMREAMSNVLPILDAIE